MIRAGQVRRAREQNLVEIDPVLPDWYEPTLDESEDTVTAGEPTKR